MSDLIRRQDAIDAILAVTGNSSVRELYEHVQEHGLSEMWSGGVNAAIDIIIAVPPVQPEPCEDTISRKAAIDAVKHAWAKGLEPTQYIEDLPSAQSEIIYCKDCVKHNKGHGYYFDGTVIGIRDCCPLVEIRGMAQGHEFDYQYCAYAERRTDERTG